MEKLCSTPKNMLTEGENGIIPGIWRVKTMADKIMYIPNDDIITICTNVWTLKLNEPTNKNAIKVPKVVNPINKKTL